MLNALHLEMIRLYRGDARRIQHFCKVHSYSKLIAEQEHVDTATIGGMDSVSTMDEIELDLGDDMDDEAFADEDDDFFADDDEEDGEDDEDQEDL